MAATDGAKALLISGREARATVQWRNKTLAHLSQRQSRMARGSHRWKRLQRRQARMRGNAFPGTTGYMVMATGAAAHNVAPRQAQTVSQATHQRIVQQLADKSSGAIQVAAWPAARSVSSRCSTAALLISPSCAA